MPSKDKEKSQNFTYWHSCLRNMPYRKGAKFSTGVFSISAHIFCKIKIITAFNKMWSKECKLNYDHILRSYITII